MTWNMVPLGECCEIVSGGTPSRKMPAYWGGTIAWATPKDISGLVGAVLDETPEYITEEGLRKSSATMLPKGAILFSSRAPIGLVAIAGRDMATNQGFKNLVPGANVNSKFLYHCMNMMAPRVAALGNGATFKEVSKRVVSSVEIPLPPLSEQKRIAAILDKADAIRRKRKAALDMADEFLRAVFLDMFGDPVTNPKGWEVVDFGHVCDVQLGKMLSKKAKQGVNPIPYLNNRVVRWREFDLTDLPQMDFSDKELKKFNLVDGDILACEGGEVGRCAIWREQLSLCSYQKALHRIRPQKGKAVPEYIQEYLFWMARRGGLADSTSTATIAHLTAIKLKGLKLPLPPINMQNDFMEIYRHYMQMIVGLNGFLHKSEAFFSSLAQRAFRGEL